MKRDLPLLALFAAVIAALGVLPAVTLLSGVPISAQSMGIMLAGAVLGPKRGALAVLLFLALVALGLPILSGGRGGLGVFMGPTLGYLVAFPIGAFVTGWIAERFARPMDFLPVLAGTIFGGIVITNLIGALGMAVMLKITYPTALGMASAFVLGDVIKAVLTAALTAAVARARPALAERH